MHVKGTMPGEGGESAQGVGVGGCRRGVGGVGALWGAQTWGGIHNGR